jgi:hypothetical protein
VLYRTGDRGRWRSPGVLEFAGRNDSQLKVRGNRVEVEEIEEALQEHPLVKEAAVRAFEEVTGEASLVAYAALCEPGRDEDIASELRSYLAASLPAYMVPNQLVLMQALPRTRTNKRDRLALPKPPGTAGALEPPRDAMEVFVARAWQEILGRPAVGRRENFFESGGNSLAATRLQSLLTKELGRPIRLIDVFSHPTVADFAHYLRGAERLSSAGTERGRRRRSARAQPGRRPHSGDSSNGGSSDNNDNQRK